MKSSWLIKIWSYIIINYFKVKNRTVRSRIQSHHKVTKRRSPSTICVSIRFWWQASWAIRYTTVWARDQDSDPVTVNDASPAEFWDSSSFAFRSACSLSHWVIPIIISSIVPVVPKNTRGPNDFRFIPTGIASKAPATEKTHVPSALQI